LRSGKNIGKSGKRMLIGEKGSGSYYEKKIDKQFLSGSDEDDDLDSDEEMDIDEMLDGYLDSADPENFNELLDEAMDDLEEESSDTTESIDDLRSDLDEDIDSIYTAHQLLANSSPKKIPDQGLRQRQFHQALHLLQVILFQNLLLLA
jgi:hypothetical protein